MNGPTHPGGPEKKLSGPAVGEVNLGGPWVGLDEILSVERGMSAEGKTGGWLGGETKQLRSRELELFLFCEMTVANMIRSL